MLLYDVTDLDPTLLGGSTGTLVDSEGGSTHTNNTI